MEEAQTTIQVLHGQKKKSGTERSKSWKFFNDMDEICGHRDIIHPSALLDSSLSPPQPSDANNEEDSIESELN